jgi:hypothetical protein
LVHQTILGHHVHLLPSDVEWICLVLIKTSHRESWNSCQSLLEPD